jgi:hypothetical protein
MGRERERKEREREIYIFINVCVCVLALCDQLESLMRSYHVGQVLSFGLLPSSSFAASGLFVFSPDLR